MSSALSELHTAHAAILSTLDTFRHMKIYELLRIDVNIHYMLSQLYIIQSDTVDNKPDLQIIINELSKFAHQRELELKLNAHSFPELDRVRLYNRRPSRRDTSHRYEHADTYLPLVIKHAVCRNILCPAGTLCTRFHGTQADHLLYLYRCRYKLLAAPAAHVCGGDMCIYYHTADERDTWAAHYQSVIGLGPPVVK
jgi:hypothetical protein